MSPLQEISRICLVIESHPVGEELTIESSRGMISNVAAAKQIKSRLSEFIVDFIFDEKTGDWVPFSNAAKTAMHIAPITPEKPSFEIKAARKMGI